MPSRLSLKQIRQALRRLQRVHVLLTYCRCGPRLAQGAYQWDSTLWTVFRVPCPVATDFLRGLRYLSLPIVMYAVCDEGSWQRGQALLNTSSVLDADSFHVCCVYQCKTPKVQSSREHEALRQAFWEGWRCNNSSIHSLNPDIAVYVYCGFSR